MNCGVRHSVQYRIEPQARKRVSERMSIERTDNSCWWFTLVRWWRTNTILYSIVIVITQTNTQSGWIDDSVAMVRVCVRAVRVSILEQIDR